MAGVVSVKLEGPGLDRLANLVDDFAPAMGKEIAAAVNATGKFHIGQVAKSISGKVAIKQKDVKKVLSMDRATPTDPEGVFTVKTSERISLKSFGAKQTKKGVSYRIEKGGKRGKIPSAFGPNIPRLGNHVYRRVGKKRLPIVKLFGPSPAGVYHKQKLLEVSKEQITERLDYELNRRARGVIVRSIRKNGRNKGLSTEQINQQIANI